MIKYIVFDLGGVMVTLDPISGDKAFKESVGYNDFISIFDPYLPKGIFHKMESGAIDAAGFREEIREVSECNADDDAIDSALNKILKDIPRYKVDLLAMLNERYSLYVLSNTNPIAMTKVPELFKAHGHSMDSLFEKLFLSYQMGVTKPDPRIYEMVLQGITPDPSEILFIDDSPANIEVAARVGFEVLLYDPADDLAKVVMERLEI